MTEEIHNKLVRDLIPNKIIANGEEPITRILNADEYKIELIKKYIEEHNELLEAINNNDLYGILGESGDVIETIKSINELNGISFDKVITGMDEKRIKRGGFDKRIYLIKVLKK